MEYRNFGTTGLKVSALGFGAGSLGLRSLTEKEAEALVTTALDSGVTLFDTARSYDLSEERLAKYLGNKRKDVVISTKIGYGIKDEEDWSYSAVKKGIEEALTTLKTDVIDIAYLHSCPIEVLRRGEAINALLDAVKEGKVRVPGYSGDNNALLYAITVTGLRAFMASYNICDQRLVLGGALAEAKRRGAGVIAKRPLANAPWLHDVCPVGTYGEEYWNRYDNIVIYSDLPAEECFLRYAAYTFGIDSVVVGSKNPEHIRNNTAIVKQGMLPSDFVSEIITAYINCGGGAWEALT
jgi:aryl-alcohol dehydrogenase-like predicted oxidoreductase